MGNKWSDDERVKLENIFLSVSENQKSITFDDLVSYGRCFPGRTEYAIKQKLRQLSKIMEIPLKTTGVSKILQPKRQKYIKNPAKNIKTSDYYPNKINKEIMCVVGDALEKYICDQIKNKSIKEKEEYKIENEKLKKECEQLREQNESQKVLLRLTRKLREVAFEVQESIINEDTN